jgi:TetR/AcrR family transcriptional regulator, ethionamide resistance regulator
MPVSRPIGLAGKEAWHKRHVIRHDLWPIVRGLATIWIMVNKSVETNKQTDGRTARAEEARSRRTALILGALERLLSTTRMRDLGVEEISAAAGITRAQFYNYFKSKYEVLASLLLQVASEVLAVYDLPDSWFVGSHTMPPLQAMTITHERMGAVWQRHGAAVREACDLWNAAPEVREAWEKIISGLIDVTERAIERERRRGIAPKGPAARSLAQALVWQGERLLFVGMIGTADAMTGKELAKVGTAMWMRAIYLTDNPRVPRSSSAKRETAR